jgi:hypothetical protein
LSRTLKDIDLLLAIQQTQALIHAATNVLLRSIGSELAGLQATFDAQHHLVGILRILGEVLVQQVERIVLRCAVQLAAVPKVCAQLQRRVKGLKALLQ